MMPFIQNGSGAISERLRERRNWPRDVRRDRTAAEELGSLGEVKDMLAMTALAFTRCRSFVMTTDDPGRHQAQGMPTHTQADHQREPPPAPMAATAAPAIVYRRQRH